MFLISNDTSKELDEIESKTMVFSFAKYFPSKRNEEKDNNIYLIFHSRMNEKSDQK